MQDITSSLQASINEACSKIQGQSLGNSNSPAVASINLEKGDYAVQALQIPRNGRLLLFSKERVRLLYAGKRNRPLFVLEDNSLLIVRDKIEIYYNTNNVQEVMRLMIRAPATSRVDISKDVKISLFSLKQQQQP